MVATSHVPSLKARLLPVKHAAAESSEANERIKKSRLQLENENERRGWFDFFDRVDLPPDRKNWIRWKHALLLSLQKQQQNSPFSAVAFAMKGVKLHAVNDKGTERNFVCDDSLEILVV
jgi:hypothetical protein